MKSVLTFDINKLERLINHKVTMEGGAMDIVGSKMVDQNKERIESQKDEEGRDFTELSPKTIAKRHPGRASMKHLKHKALIDTGRMKDSFTYKKVGNTLEVGVTVPYADIHQTGGYTTIEDNGKLIRIYVPKRTVVGLSVDNIRELKEVIQEAFGQ